MKKLLLLSASMLLPSLAMAEENSTVCRVLATHTPTADVTHQGKADINSSTFEVPEIIKVPLDINLAQRVSSLTGKGVQMEAPMGMVEIHPDGSIQYNGEDWTSPVMSACGQSHVEKTIVEVEAPKEPKPILNQAKILNTTPIINRVPAGDRAGEISEALDRPKEKRPTIVLDPVMVKEKIVPHKKTEERSLIDVRPTQAMPPKDVAQDVASEVKEEIKTKEPEVIQGGAYREIFINE